MQRFASNCTVSIDAADADQRNVSDSKESLLLRILCKADDEHVGIHGTKSLTVKFMSKPSTKKSPLSQKNVKCRGCCSCIHSSAACGSC